MQHPDEGTIHAWIDCALTADEASGIERHVAECRECAERVAEARGMIAGASRIVSSLDIVRGDVIPTSPAFASRSVWRRLHLSPARAALAATVLLAVGSMLAIRDSGRRTRGSVIGFRDSELRTQPAVAPAAAPALPSETGRHGAPLVDAAPVQRQRAIRAPAGRVAPTEAAESAARQPQSPAVQGRVAGATAAVVPPAVVGGVVTPQPPAPASEAKAAGVAGAGGAERRVMDAGRAAQAAPQRPQALSAARNLATVVDAVPGAPICYEIEHDTAVWLHSIPQRFTLTRDSVTHRNVVRTLSTDSTLDSVVAGSEWSGSSASAYRVLLPTAQPNERLSLVWSPNEATVEARLGNNVKQMGLRRSFCPP